MTSRNCSHMSKRWGPVRLGNAITRVKSVFKYGLDNGLTEKPVRYGGEFKKPDKAVLRRHRARRSGGRRTPPADRHRRRSASCDDHARRQRRVRERRLCHPPADGSGPGTRLARLPSPEDRHCPPLPALAGDRCSVFQEAVAKRPAPKDKADADLVFLRASGRSWVEHPRSQGSSVSAWPSPGW